MKKADDKRAIELKTRHPEVYDIIFNLGREQERKDIIKSVIKMAELTQDKAWKDLANMLDDEPIPE